MLSNNSIGFLQFSEGPSPMPKETNANKSAGAKPAPAKKNPKDNYFVKELTQVKDTTKGSFEKQNIDDIINQ